MAFGRDTRRWRDSGEYGAAKTGAAKTGGVVLLVCVGVAVVVAGWLGMERRPDAGEARLAAGPENKVGEASAVPRAVGVPNSEADMGDSALFVVLTVTRALLAGEESGVCANCKPSTRPEDAGVDGADATRSCVGVFKVMGAVCR